MENFFVNYSAFLRFSIDIFPWLGVLFLGFILFWWIFKKEPPTRFIKFSFWFGIIFLSFKGLLGAVGQTFYWYSNEYTRAFLPPQRSWDGYFAYMWNNFLDNPVTTIVIAFLIWFAIFLLNKISKGRIFYDIEYYLGPLGVIYITWELDKTFYGISINALQLYIVAILFLGALFSLILMILGRKFAPLVYFWAPIALIIIVWFNGLIPILLRWFGG